MKVIVTVMVTLLLNILCEKGLSVISWVIVFIPFILMTVIVSMLLYVFGLDAATGSLNYKCNGTNSNTKCGDGISIDDLGNIIVYDPEYNSSKNPVYYNSPNIIIPNPHNNDNIIKNNTNYYNSIPTNSSSPAYQS
jgi:tetrahydromethanopterin S-methyltransferase subunit E